MLLCRKASVWCGEQGFVTCWLSALCQSTHAWISPRWRLADRPILGTTALPYPHCRLSAPFTYNIIQMQSLSIPITFLPTVSSNYPLTAVFVFFSPHSTKCGPRLVTAGQKRSESASWLSFLGIQIYCQCRKTWQREVERKTERWLGLRGLYKHDEQIKDLSINQAVTTCCQDNWIVPGSPERTQTILSLALLNY